MDKVIKDKVLRTYKLNVGYKQTVVSDVTIDVMPGEIIALIGPNGAGKSTILNTIIRELRELSGKVYILFFFPALDKAIFEDFVPLFLSFVNTSDPLC